MVRYELNANNEYEKIEQNKELFILTKEHSIPYKEHNYQKYKEIINDINNKTKNAIKSQLKNYSYLNTFLKSFAILNKDKISSSGELYNLFKDEYGPINIDINSIDEDTKNKKIEKYKKNKNNKNDIKIEEIFSIKNITNGAFTFLKNYRHFHSEMDNNLLNFKINDDNIVTKINTNFERKKILYTKDIYIIMTSDMIENINNKNNVQYFMDVTYYATPPNNKKFKLLIILAFNNNLYKTLLCNISIISNENKETFISVLNYLKNRYNFNPGKITIDYSLSELNAIQYIYPNSLID